MLITRYHHNLKMPGLVTFSTCLSSRCRTEMLSFFATDIDLQRFGDESACAREKLRTAQGREHPQLLFVPMPGKAAE